MQETIKSINPSIEDLLPYGSINTLARQFSTTRETIYKIIRGNFSNANGSKVEVDRTEVIKAAWNMITNHKSKMVDGVRSNKGKIKKILAEKAS